MQFLSDNAASVHPAVWDAMRAADAPDSPYDTDAVSRRLDDAFSALFGREVTPNTIAALLTIMGYSLYDNVVVFGTADGDDFTAFESEFQRRDIGNVDDELGHGEYCSGNQRDSSIRLANSSKK